MITLPDYLQFITEVVNPTREAHGRSPLTAGEAKAAYNLVLEDERSEQLNLGQLEPVV